MALGRFTPPQGHSLTPSPLSGLTRVAVWARPVGIVPSSCGPAWPNLPGQLASRIVSIRALASSWHFFLDAQANQAAGFNSTPAVRPLQFSGALCALPEYRAQSRQPFSPTPAAGRCIRTDEALPLTLGRSVSPETPQQLLQPVDYLLKVKPWSRL